MEPSTRKNLIYLLLAILVLLIIAGVTVGSILYFRSEESGSSESVVRWNKQYNLNMEEWKVLLRRPLWGWRCEDNRCEKFKLTTNNNKTAIGLNLCRLQCNNEAYGTLWPKPSEAVKVSKEVSRLNVNDISFTTNNFEFSSYFLDAKTRFIDMQNRKIPKQNPVLAGGVAMTVAIIAETNDMSEIFLILVMTWLLHFISSLWLHNRREL